jgi:hypothetical protein
MSLTGNELVNIQGVAASGGLSSVPTVTTTQSIANLSDNSPFGTKWYVNGTSGSDTANNGTSAGTAFKTIQKAVNSYHAGDTITVSPGSYNETVTIARPSGGEAVLTIIGYGPAGSIAIAPSTTDAGALINHADDVTIINVGLAANGTGTSLVNTGARLRLYDSKLENDDGTGYCAQFTLGTIAQRTAHTRGGGADCRIQGCELAWAANGILVTCTDYGAVTELAIVDNYFHDLDTKHISESTGSGGAAGVMFNSLLISGNTFSRDEAGTEPTDYIILNGANTNTGLVTQNSFSTALAGGKNLVSTALIWSGNLMTGGISTGQPS